MNKPLIIVQARMGSTRLPGKVMKPIGDKTLIQVMLERLQRSKLAGQIVVATTVDSSDDVLRLESARCNIDCFRGSVSNLLERHYQCALEHNAETILKIPSDCPLIDPFIVDEGIRCFERSDCDYVSNLHPESYPDGQDVEVFSFKALKKAREMARADFELEHTTPIFWENPQIFKIVNFGVNHDLSRVYRIVVDYCEDYRLVKEVYESLSPFNQAFSVEEIIRFLQENPHIAKINKMHIGKNWYSKHMDQLFTIHNQGRLT